MMPFLFIKAIDKVIKKKTLNSLQQLITLFPLSSYPPKKQYN